jgi:quercetin dioxygenase-like cupin family protein
METSTDVTAVPTVLTTAAVSALPVRSLGDGRGVTHRVLWDNGTSMAGVMTVAPGCQLGEHTHRVNHHHLWVVQGHAVVLGALLGQGAYAHIPAGVAHNIDATGTEGCTVYYLYLRAAD